MSKKSKLKSIVRWLGFISLFLGIGLLNWMSIPGYCQQEAGRESSAPAALKTHIQAADALVEKMTVEDLEEAIKEYEKVLELDSENFEALWKIAQAYCYIIDIKTNILIIEKDEYKPILKELGKTAERYAKKAYKINPEAKEAVSVNLWAYGARASAMGIVPAIFKGAAGHFKDLAKELIKIDDTYRNAHGYKSLGRFYFMAPFPMGSKKKTKFYYEKALEVVQDLLEPHYWLGMTYLKEDKYDLAKKEFEYVINNPSNEREKHFIAEFKKQAKEQLGRILEKEAE